jgi:hypothetical protein
MSDIRYEDFRNRIEGRSRILSARIDVNVARLDTAHARFTQESDDIRTELASLMTAARLLEHEDRRS